MQPLAACAALLPHSPLTLLPSPPGLFLLPLGFPLPQRAIVQLINENRETERAIAASRAKPRARRVIEEHRFTQAEVIVEAAHTEAINVENLQRILAMEEESKRRAIVTKARSAAPTAAGRTERSAQPGGWVGSLGVPSVLSSNFCPPFAS